MRPPRITRSKSCADAKMPSCSTSRQSFITRVYTFVTQVRGRGRLPTTKGIAARLMAAALLPQGGECVGPAQADHTGEGIAAKAVPRRVTVGQRIPTTMFDCHPRAGR